MDLHHVLPQLREDVTFHLTQSQRDPSFLDVGGGDEFGGIGGGVEGGGGGLNSGGAINRNRLSVPGMDQIPDLPEQTRRSSDMSLSYSPSMDPETEAEASQVMQQQLPSAHSEMWWSGKYDFAVKVSQSDTV
jgi:hypothetical protein